jgi:hypothetical protein
LEKHIASIFRVKEKAKEGTCRNTWNAQCVTSQKTILFIVTVMRTSNPLRLKVRFYIQRYLPFTGIHMNYFQKEINFTEDIKK